MATNYKKKDDPKKEIPDIIVDPNTKKNYLRGKLLGKGGFARCYELTDPVNKKIMACKIVSKTLLTKPHQKDKMSQEISIHRSLNHKHIVGFYNFFEDPENVYIILELCRRRSLMELHKRRKAVTEPETKYFLLQILTGVKYLHDHKVIHRDLKLGNLFINDEMEVKIGDFGLATTMTTGERKKTLCGTPNYIAPEILCKTGHGFEVDVWSIGCIMYTLLVGKPPFETDSLKETYKRIKENKYHIPSRVSPVARTLIKNLLHQNPKERPTIDQILQHEFMTGYIPSRLPTSCLTMAPRYDAHLNTSVARKPLLEINTKDGSPVVTGKVGVKRFAIGSENPTRIPQGGEQFAPVSALKKANDNPLPIVEPAGGSKPDQQQPEDCHLNELFKQVDEVVAADPDLKQDINEDESEDPNAVPMIWVSKWVDYSDKYGLGYQLSDDSMGVLFNDFTKLLLLPDEENIHYIERNSKEHYHRLSDYPQSLYKKVTLLRYFRNYMNEHLLKAGAAMAPREGDELIRIPSLKTYFRTRSAIILHLTNGTLQINFFEDHTKIILCPLMGAVTYIDRKRNFRTFRLDGIKKFGCSSDLGNRLRYGRNMIQKLIQSAKSGSSSRSGASSATHQPAQNL